MLIREGMKRSAPGVQATLVGPTCSTGYDSLSGADINGAVIDLQSLEYGGTRYRTGAVAAYIWSTAGSTAADQKVTVGLRLQHGDSSGGGGMVDYSTAFTPTAKVFNTTALTTPMSAWSTGLFAAGGPPHAYDLRAAKRYIRAVLTPTINDQSTSTAAAAVWKRIEAVVMLSAPDAFPEASQRGAFTTATATAT